MPKCNICGHERFIAGPFGRLSRVGLPPRCAACGSLERHRAMRCVFEALRERWPFEAFSLIRFSDDPIVDDGWFRSSEVSLFEGENSLDIQAIARPDEAYDVVVCSHIVEHVADDRRAIRELTRILSPRGFIILAYPRVEEGDVTEDWGFADPDKNGHYRGYGRDFDRTVCLAATGAEVIAIEGEDPVTGDAKKFMIISKLQAWAERVLERVAGARLISAPA